MTDTDSHLAAYAKGLEDAAQIAEEHGGWSLGPHVARCIRALAPLPPGSRVVVVPPDAEERMAEAIWLAWAGRVETDAPWQSLGDDWKRQVREEATAALRALTEGDDRD